MMARLTQNHPKDAAATPNRRRRTWICDVRSDPGEYALIGIHGALAFKGSAVSRGTRGLTKDESSAFDEMPKVSRAESEGRRRIRDWRTCDVSRHPRG
jgi:hypothetical protein